MENPQSKLTAGDLTVLINMFHYGWTQPFTKLIIAYLEACQPDSKESAHRRAMLLPGNEVTCELLMCSKNGPVDYGTWKIEKWQGKVVCNFWQGPVLIEEVSAK